VLLARLLLLLSLLVCGFQQHVAMVHATAAYQQQPSGSNIKVNQHQHHRRAFLMAPLVVAVATLAPTFGTFQQQQQLPQPQHGPWTWMPLSTKN
jgi:hypothetical protein